MEFKIYNENWEIEMIDNEELNKKHNIEKGSISGITYGDINLIHISDVCKGDRLDYMIRHELIHAFQNATGDYQVTEYSHETAADFFAAHYVEFHKVYTKIIKKLERED